MCPMRYVTLIVMPVLLAGCHVQGKHAADGDENVTINADESGHVSFNLPFMNGQVKLPEGVLHNGEFDIDGVKMIPGGTMTGFSVFAKDKGATVNLGFKAPQPPDQVRSYFADQFKQQGVEVAAAGDALSGTSKDGDPFTIHVSPAATGSTGTIEIQDKD